jgi:phospholipase C
LLGALVLASPLLAQPAKPGISQIEHIVFIVKENRTFDNVFGTFPGADAATSGTISTGAVVTLGHAQDQYWADIAHNASDFRLAYDGGEMDGFDLERGGNNNG